MSLYAVLDDTELDVIQWLDGFESRFAAEWPEQGLIGRKSLIQHTGFAPDEIRLRVLLHSQWCDPSAELAKLKTRLDEAQPLSFVLGTGEYRGKFALVEIAAVTRQTDGFGALMALEADITLRECIGDPAEPNPPGVLLPGWQAPVTANGDVLDVPVSSVFADSAIGSVASAVSDSIAGMAQAARAVSAVTNLAAVARVDPLTAVSLAGPVAHDLRGAAQALPIEAVSGIGALAQTARAMTMARDALHSAASELDATGVASIASQTSMALAGANAAIDALEWARGALAACAAAISSRKEVVL